MASAPEESYRKFLRYFAMVIIISVTGSVGLQMYLRIQRDSSAKPLCPPCACACDCPTRFRLPNETGRAENDQAIREEMQKDLKTLRKKQLELMKIVDEESLQRKEVVIRNINNSRELFQREAERCRAGVLTCEEAREKAEAEFIFEKKRTAEWEKRALDSGWRDPRKVYT